MQQHCKREPILHTTDNMKPNTLDPKTLSEIITHLLDLKSQLGKQHHRSMVLISGSPEWATELILGLADAKLIQDALLITNSDENDHSALETSVFGRNVAKQLNHALSKATISGSKVHRLLGQEVQDIIWDGYTGIHPDGLAASAGLIKAGHLLYLFIPERDAFLGHSDPDYSRMLSPDISLEECSAHFHQHLLQTISNDPAICVIEQDKPLGSAILPVSQKTTFHALPTFDQENAIVEIKRVALGHRNRPLVIRADRGRGKTSALGLAAAQLVQEEQKNILITAPSLKACQTAFLHFNEVIEKAQCSKSPGSFSFVPPDELLQSERSCDVLIIDEAASLPSATLTALTERHPRIIFSTTVHGYEGTGRGFAVRFQKTLHALKPGYKEIQLKQAIRWHDGDPLENAINKALLLDTELPDLKSLDHVEGSVFEWFHSDKLANNIALLRSVVALLVTAHYQTSPSDIRLMLDHPKVKIGLLHNQQHVVGVLMVIEEGGIDDSNFANDLIAGKRRPPGHLVPQALTYSMGDIDILKRKTWRIVRIATHPDLQSQGFGSRMLQCCLDSAEQESIDYISSSFGFTESLIRFWAQNQFILLRLGKHIDAASGRPSAIVARAGKEKGQAKTKGKTKGKATTVNQLLSWQATFRTSFKFDLARDFKHLCWRDLAQVLKSLPADEHNTLSQDQYRLLQDFAYHHRQYQECEYLLFELVWRAFCGDDNVGEKLTESEQCALLRVILQGHSWPFVIKALALTGKKDLLATLRNAVAKLV